MDIYGYFTDKSSHLFNTPAAGSMVIYFIRIAPVINIARTAYMRINFFGHIYPARP